MIHLGRYCAPYSTSILVVVLGANFIRIYGGKTLGLGPLVELNVSILILWLLYG